MEDTTVMNPQSFSHVALTVHYQIVHCQTLERGATMDLSIIGTSVDSPASAKQEVYSSARNANHSSLCLEINTDCL
jgi:hypothetical protein